MLKHILTHIHEHMYINIYSCVCVCVCVVLETMAELHNPAFGLCVRLAASLFVWLAGWLATGVVQLSVLLLQDMKIFT